MGKVSVIKKIGSWRGMILLLGALLCIVTLLKAYAFKSFQLPAANTSFNYRTFLSRPANETDTREAIEAVIHKIQHHMRDASPSKVKHASFLADILGLIVAVHKSVQACQRPHGEDPAEYFLTEEIRKYVGIKPNRLLRKQNFMGANGTFASIGHGCFSLKKQVEEYMDYDVGDICNDDWKLGQKLMVHGCDPLPRRRCFARAPQLY